MRSFVALYLKEMENYFVTPIGYAILCSFWLASGFFFSFNTLFVSAIDMVNAFHNMSILLMLLVPLMTMRSFPEEYRQGTYELLVSLGVGSHVMVLSKFSALLTLLILMLFGSVASVAVLVAFSDPDIGPIVGGYFGITTLGAVFIAIGLLISVFSSNQIVAAVVTWIVLLAFWFLDYSMALTNSKFLSEIIMHLSLSIAYLDLIRGVIDLGVMTYFFSLIGFCVFAASTVLELRK